ncbi:unnamed protein product [Prorocentrum cordatum]|uniref:Uncharacterized protein n=1 Tax=Prorocentrum cordatum TaxID=2364126 RepID=A0ABN9UN29_9DINO|nr:unnamed protein product [Polarella glacialis]
MALRGAAAPLRALARPPGHGVGSRHLRAPAGLRCCSSGRPTRQRSVSGVLDLLTCNPRHMLSSAKLRILNVVYPRVWDPRSFREGVAERLQARECVAGRGRLPRPSGAGVRQASRRPEGVPRWIGGRPRLRVAGGAPVGYLQVCGQGG